MYMYPMGIIFDLSSLAQDEKYLCHEILTPQHINLRLTCIQDLMCTHIFGRCSVITNLINHINHESLN